MQDVGLRWAPGGLPRRGAGPPGAPSGLAAAAQGAGGRAEGPGEAGNARPRPAPASRPPSRRCAGNRDPRVRGGWRRGQAGEDARLGATARGRAQHGRPAGLGSALLRAPAPWRQCRVECRGSPVLCTQVRAAPSPTPRHPYALPAGGWGPGLQVPPPTNLRASPGKGPGSPPHCQPGSRGQGPWASRVAWQKLPAVRGSPTSRIWSHQHPQTAFSSTHFYSRALGEGEGHEGGYPKTSHALAKGPSLHTGKVQDTLELTLWGPSLPLPCSWLFLVPWLFISLEGRRLGWSFTDPGSV